jgi:hypoxanthine phosphoribosyltransferase
MDKAKQDPESKAVRVAAADGKVYFSYASIHTAVTSLVPRARAFRPDVIIAIGGGGFIPARMLRTELKVPILAVSLELYNDATNTKNAAVKRVQWYDEDEGLGALKGKRVLIMDEVDDTRTTLKYCVEEVLRTSQPAAIAVAVVHNKLKPKEASLPTDVLYMAAEDVPNMWNCYPWDAAAYGHSIEEHEALARACLGQGSGSEAAVLGRGGASEGSGTAAGGESSWVLPVAAGIALGLALGAVLQSRR